MEALLILFVIGLIGVILIGSILGLTSSGRMSKLEQQNRNLNQRLKALEDVHLASRALDKPAPIKVVKPKEDRAPEPTQKPLENVPTATPQPVAAKTAPISKKTAPPKKPNRNLEELIGGQWSVWVGGLALLVGAVLLIRFSIEAGFFGPAARIGMAVILGVILLLAGEWLKRSDDKVLKGKLGDAAKALQGNASVPGLLSAVGIFTLLGASYAAHELYYLIPAFAAFMALAVISVGAMALSLRQGPLLAAIGLLASFATPLLIQTETPSLLILVIYLLLIGGAALALSRRTGWGWLATGSVFGWLGWSFMSIDAATNGQLVLWGGFLALGFVVTVWFAERDKTESPKGLLALNMRPILALLWVVVAAVLILNVLQIAQYRREIGLNATCILGLGFIAATIFTSFVYRRQAGHLVTAGVFALAATLIASENTQVAIFGIGIFAVVGLSLYKMFSADAAKNERHTMGWAGFATALGLFSTYIIHLSNTGHWPDPVYTVVAFGLTVILLASAFILFRRGGSWEIVSALTAGSALGWLLGSYILLESLPFSLAMSLGGALSALLVWRFRLPGARMALIGLTGLVFAHALLDQFAEAEALSARPIFNELWIYLALPTVILGGAAYVLHRRKEVGELGRFLNGVIEASALAGLALFAVFQIRHLSNDGMVYAESLGHAELGLQVSIGLCFTLAGLSKRFAGNMVLSKIAEIISYATLAIFGIGSLFAFSPLFKRGEDITGNLFFNSLTTGLLVPTVLLGICAIWARGKRPEIYINILGGLALAGALFWVTAMIRFIYNGENIDVWSANFGDMELWTISAVWLAFGVALLALGVWRRERALRIASGIVIILTVLKAFLIDMAGLEGVLRAMSFVALGLILIVIGRAYQRYWLSDGSRNQPAQINEIGEEE